MRNWLKTVLFMSAFSPALFSLAYVRYQYYGMDRDIWQLMIIGVIGSALPFMILYLTKRTAEQIPLEAKKIESNDFMLFMFIASYLLPIVAKASDMDFDGIALLTLGMALVLWVTGFIPTHPVLRAFQFRFYKVESSSGVVYTLISNREILDPKNIKAVKKISNSMLLEC